MRKVKTVLMVTARDEGKVRVWLQGLESEQSFKDRRCAKTADVCSFPPEGLLGKVQAKIHQKHISMTWQEKNGNPIMKPIPIQCKLSRNDVSIFPASCPWQDATLSTRWAASAAACVAVDVKGRAVVELQKDAVMPGQNGEFALRLKQVG